MKIHSSILQMVPYVPGKPISETKREFGVGTVYKLASNENPLGPSPKAMEAMHNAIAELHLYPDSNCFDLKQAAQKYYNVDAQKMVFGNGSNELIDLLIRLYCSPGDKILTTKSAFVAYKVCAHGARVEVTEAPLTLELKTDLQAVANAWTRDHKLIFLPNPNNPTGTYFSKQDFDQFLEKFAGNDDVRIVLDEAYVEYVRANDYPNGLDYFRKFSNVIVIRTTSKVFGLAGIRLGVLFGDAQTVDYLNRIRNPFNVNSLAMVATIAAFEDTEFIQKTQKLTWQGLDYFYQELKSLGLKFWPSQANFVLFDTGRDVTQINTELLKRGVILRPVKNYGLTTQLRISVGLPFENQAAMKALKEVLAL